MIVNLRGTSGAGKSTIVRNLMARYDHREAVHEPGRKQPIGYICYPPEYNPNKINPLYVVGHYETPCGGGDTIPSLGEVYTYVWNAAIQGRDVIYEGLIIQSDIRRCGELHAQGQKLLVIGLSTPLEDCVAGVRARREARGDTKPFDPAKTLIPKMKTMPNQQKRLLALGVDFRLLGREDGMKAVLEYLGWNPIS
jgi:hypothetical protein